MVLWHNCKSLWETQGEEQEWSRSLTRGNAGGSGWMQSIELTRILDCSCYLRVTCPIMEPLRGQTKIVYGGKSGDSRAGGNKHQAALKLEYSIAKHFYVPIILTCSLSPLCTHGLTLPAAGRHWPGPAWSSVGACGPPGRGGPGSRSTRWPEDLNC